MPKDESDDLKTIRVDPLARAIRSIMGAMNKRRYQWVYGSGHLYVFVILPKLPGSTLYKATH